MGGDFKRQKLTIHQEFFLKGIQETIEDNDVLMKKVEIQNVLVKMKKNIMALQQEEKKKTAEKNLAEGRDYLIENAKKRDVNTLGSGLGYSRKA